MLGRGGGQVVSMLAFYSDDPSLNLAVVYSFSVKIVFEKNKNKQKEAGVGPFKKNNVWEIPKTSEYKFKFLFLLSSHPILVSLVT